MFTERTCGCMQYKIKRMRNLINHTSAIYINVLQTKYWLFVVFSCFHTRGRSYRTEYSQCSQHAAPPDVNQVTHINSGAFHAVFT